MGPELLPRVEAAPLLVPVEVLVGGRLVTAPARAVVEDIAPGPVERVLVVPVILDDDALPVLPDRVVVPTVDRLRVAFVAVPLAGRAVGLNPLAPLDGLRVPSVL